MTTDDYTPTTWEVRTAYVEDQSEYSDAKWSEAAFDRWLAAHEAALLAAQPATADRETLARTIWAARHYSETWEEAATRSEAGRLNARAGCYAEADAIFASGVIVPANKIHADTLEAAADTLDEHMIVPVDSIQGFQASYDYGPKIKHAYGAVQWLRARAAELRGNA